MYHIFKKKNGALLNSVYDKIEKLYVIWMWCNIYYEFIFHYLLTFDKFYLWNTFSKSKILKANYVQYFSNLFKFTVLKFRLLSIRILFQNLKYKKQIISNIFQSFQIYDTKVHITHNKYSLSKPKILKTNYA